MFDIFFNRRRINKFGSNEMMMMMVLFGSIPSATQKRFMKRKREKQRRRTMEMVVVQAQTLTIY